MNGLGVDLAPYLVDEGFLYRLVPVRSEGEEIAVDTARAYRNLIKLGDYSNLDDPTIYFSYEDHYARMLVAIRQSFNSLAAAFVHENNAKMAEIVLTTAVDRLYQPHLRPSYTNLRAAELLIMLGRKDKADALVRSAFDYYTYRVQAADDLPETATSADSFILSQAVRLLAQLEGVGENH